MRERIRVWKGDITTLAVDAIVNAANSRLMPGGGVCGAIHAAAGPELLAECLQLGGCPTGEARLTRGYRLKAKYVIHAVGPIWHGGSQNEAQLLASCYRQSLELATAHDIQSIAFPSISTGIYGYPLERAARVAVQTIVNYLAEHDVPREVVLVVYADGDYPIVDRALREGLEAFKGGAQR
ncbi:MAG: O-acetyl-ADP-ribose deacetylase [Anaerolineales bacterium]